MHEMNILTAQLIFLSLLMILKLNIIAESLVFSSLIAFSGN